MSDSTILFKSILIVGCGDVGKRVAAAWSETGLAVSGIVTSDSSAATLRDRQINAYQMNFKDPHADLPILSDKTLIYYFVPPPSTGRHDTHCQHFLAALSAQSTKVSRIVAISTTGVYGNCEGQRVTEDRPPNPQVDRARRRLDMEQQLRHWCDAHSKQLVILRVGGIYGPGRLPLQRIRDGVPVLHPHLAPSTNRIHADDLAAICVAAAQVDVTFRIYNVSDGTDSNMTEYFYTLADYFGLPRPPAVDWPEAEKVMSKGMLSYLRESRRVDNRRMLDELNITLKYPTLEDGLVSCKA